MPLLQDAEFTPIREALAVFLVHSYTRQAYAAGAEDAHGDTADAPSGDPVTGVDCAYATRETLVNDLQGSRLVTIPVLTLAWDDPLTEGDRVSNVRDQLGALLLAGPAVVETVNVPAGLGAATQKFAFLRAARTVR